VIIVLGSRHDRVATSLVAAWPGAALCDADDLVAAGWVWRADGPRTWVVGGARVPDGEVSGVFVRRSTVHAAELVSVHADDRAYLAAETHAFLVFVLATTDAVVANPVGDGALGDEVVRPERWMPLAVECGLRLAPLRLTSASRARRHFTTRTVEVVGDESFVDGAVPARCRAGAVQLASELDMRWAMCVFDGHHRLVAITSSAAPGPVATDALGALLRGVAA
jgi:hypothetical protein